MNLHAWLLGVAFLLVAAGGTAVVFTRDPRRQVFVAGGQGLLLALLFYLLHSPDVALSQVTVGTITVPLLLFLALLKLERPR